MSLSGTGARRGGEIMFAQVISGRITDEAAVAPLLQRWMSDLAPGAAGWLSSTSGATADGEYVVFACFESAEAARRNSDRPEQGEWWAEVERCFTEPPTFADYDDVLVLRGGVSPGAGFVQAMFGSVSDAERERELSRAFVAADTDQRPDLLGGIIGISDDGRFAQAMYFSSEAEARVGEQSEMPPEMAEGFAEEQELITEIRYLDLASPAIHTAD
jgi:hypothetical protein